MIDRTSTTWVHDWVHEEANKHAGTVKGINGTDPNDMAFKLVIMFVLSLGCEFSFFCLFLLFFLPFFAFFAFFSLFCAIGSSDCSFSRLSAPLEVCPPPIAAPDNDDRDEGMMCVCLLRNSIKRRKNEPSISQQVEEGRVRPLQSFETLATAAILTSDNNDCFLLEGRLDLSSSFFLVSSGGGSGSFEIETSAILDVGVAASASPSRCSFSPS